LISKLYFRRGKSRRLRGLYKGAKEDLMWVLDVIPDEESTECRATKRELALVERAQQEGRRNRQKQQQAMKNVFETKSSPDLPLEKQTVGSSTSPSHQSPGEPGGLYQDRKAGRQFSTLRSRRKKVREEEDIPEERPKLTYWQYYMAVVGRIAEAMLVLLGDEEFIQQQERRRRETD